METKYNWIEKYLKDEDDQIVRVKEIRAAPAVGQNENFLGCLTRLRVTVELGSRGEATRSYVLKQRPLERRTAELCDQTGVFATEIKVYTELLKAASHRLREAGDSDLMWPHCLGVSDENILLLDLKEEGFAVLPKNRGHSLAEAELVMQALGRFHAVSRAVVQSGEFLPASLPPPLYCQNCTYMANFYKKPLEELSAVIRLYWPPEWSHVSEKVMAAAQDVGIKLANLWESTKGEFDVVNHGDCWTNNIMFKYGADKKDISLRFVDFQSCHHNSPAWDLAYYLENAVRPPDRLAHGTHLLQTYLSSLAASSGRTAPLPSSAALSAALRAVDYFAFLNAVVCAPLTISADEPGFEYDYPELYRYETPPQQVLNQRAKSSFYNYEKARALTMENLKRFISQNTI